MKALKAKFQDLNCIITIVHSTINKIFPKYYPKGAIDYFIAHHNMNNIMTDIKKDQVYLFINNNQVIGTCSTKANEVYRLFVIPEFQGKGYGTWIMNYIENMIFSNYDHIKLHASFPAIGMYRNRGYKEISFDKLPTTNVDFLCYYEMQLNKENCNISI